MKMSRGKFRKDEILFLMIEENVDITYWIEQKFFPTDWNNPTDFNFWALITWKNKLSVNWATQPKIDFIIYFHRKHNIFILYKLNSKFRNRKSKIEIIRWVVSISWRFDTINDYLLNILNPNNHFCSIFVRVEFL